MSPAGITIAAAVLALLITIAWWIVRNRLAISSIEYLGHEFRLRRTYFTYGGYRNDPQNLQSEDLSRIERLLTSHVVGPMFRDEPDFGKRAGAIKFPGYGMAGLPVQSADQSLMLVAVEIPGTTKWRYLLAGKVQNGVQLLDDFVFDGDRITGALYANGVISYRSLTKTVREQRI